MIFYDLVNKTHTLEATMKEMLLTYISGTTMKNSEHVGTDE